MSDDNLMADALSKTQIEALSKQLDNLEGGLRALLDATASGAAPVKLKDNQGRLSRMDEMHNQSILIANRNVTRNRLKAIGLAREKLEEGFYGFCDDCDEPIAFNRLMAYPDAIRCISCQSRFE